ncbi:MAG: flotillin family protein, partial [Pseudomonadota bacterium]
MSIDFIMAILGGGVLLVVAIIVIGMIFSRLYTRASKEISFVRTGAGGQKVVMNGGALVFPVLHEVIPVNMNTLRLEVRRANEQALITRDRMRVDVLAEFYVRVQPTADS